jgi:hypothetical protein
MAREINEDAAAGVDRSLAFTQIDWHNF